MGWPTTVKLPALQGRYNSETGRANIDADNNNDGTYALISNPELMTVARNAESVNSSWTGGVNGSGCLKRGNVGVASSDSVISLGGFTSVEGAGKYQSGVTGMAVRRGGGSSNTTISGIFALHSKFNDTDAFSGLTFRCAYRRI